MKRKEVRKIKFHVHNEEWFCCTNNITRAEEVKRKSDEVEAEKTIRWHWRMRKFVGGGSKKEKGK